MKSPMAIALLLFSASLAQAGAPWLQEKGRLFTSLGLFYYRAPEAFNAHGDKVSVPEYRKTELRYYGEYGASDDWTLGINAPLQYIHTKDQPSNYGVGDTELFARRGLGEWKGWKAAWQPLMKLPSSYRDEEAPVGGRGTLDAENAFALGRSFSLFNQQHYVTGTAAYRWRGGRDADQWRYEMQLGVRPASSLLVIPSIARTYPTHETGNERISLAGESDYSLTQMGVAVMYDITPRDAILIGTMKDMDGRNTGAGQSTMVQWLARW